MTLPSWAGLHATAETIGHYRYAELGFAQLSGHKAAEGGAVAPFLAGAGGAHAWRAALFEELLPVSVGLPGAAELTVPPTDGFDATLRELAALEVGILVTVLVEDVYPALLAAWAAHAATASPVADAALVRTLRRAGADLAAVRDEGATLRPRDSRPEVPVALRRLVAESCTFGRRVPASGAGEGA